jgi:hypothetical protein
MENNVKIQDDTQSLQSCVMVRSFRDFFDKEVANDFDNGFNKYQTFTERNLTIMQLIDRYNKKYNNQCDHYFPTYLKNKKRNYKPCEFCGTIRQNEP